MDQLNFLSDERLNEIRTTSEPELRLESSLIDTQNGCNLLRIRDEEVDSEGDIQSPPHGSSSSGLNLFQKAKSKFGNYLHAHDPLQKTSTLAVSALAVPPCDLEKKIEVHKKKAKDECSRKLRANHEAFATDLESFRFSSVTSPLLTTYQVGSRPLNQTSPIPTSRTSSHSRTSSIEPTSPSLPPYFSTPTYTSTIPEDIETSPDSTTSLQHLNAISKILTSHASTSSPTSSYFTISDPILDLNPTKYMPQFSQRPNLNIRPSSMLESMSKTVPRNFPTSPVSALMPNTLHSPTRFTGHHRGILTTDLDCKILMANEQFCIYYKSPPSQLIKKEAYTLFSKVYQTKIIERLSLYITERSEGVIFCGNVTT
ncbi:hypothetical protein HMI56_000393 [Coelomomyces lativittatus]|nr:hypothetical protein HMI56_000393 [Coelomomyces lativittatus]